MSELSPVEEYRIFNDKVQDMWMKNCHMGISKFKFFWLLDLDLI